MRSSRGTPRCSGVLGIINATSTRRSGPAQEDSSPDTLVFVDVDGVLNVGVGDPGRAPLEFSEGNVERALARWGNGDTPLKPSGCVERIMSTYTREVGRGEESTYAKFASSPNTNVSDVLVARLAQIIEAAGSKRSTQVVLSSTWRAQKHLARVGKLEEAIGKHLGRPFEFDGRTPMREDGTAEARLKCVADFAAKYAMRQCASGRLRILMLEDFHLTAFGEWRCSGNVMTSVEAVERYLVACIPPPVLASARLIHTFDQWMTPSGLRVKVGCGLTQAHLSDALAFLGAFGVDAGAAPQKIPKSSEGPGVMLKKLSTGGLSRRASTISGGTSVADGGDITPRRSATRGRQHAMRMDACLPALVTCAS